MYKLNYQNDQCCFPTINPFISIVPKKVIGLYSLVAEKDATFMTESAFKRVWAACSF